jgi:alkanesulfonate monooxygenase SsuD/methylene tetrahydromethanopterin reductase-like flavin-dependent oxidoreductase (luciferase family)
MKFSLYSEMQYWGGKSREQQYAETLEQIVNADRLGFDAYAVIEHFFFDRFSISPDPMQLFAAAAQRTRDIRFRTLLHVLPYHNPAVLASRVAECDILTGGRYEFGFGRGHGWIPEKAGVDPVETRERYDESLAIFLAALENERFSYDGSFYRVKDSHITPRPTRRMRIFAGGTSDSTYVLAGERGWSMCVPPLLPYEALRSQLDLYRQSCAEHGNEPDIVWIHLCYLDEDRVTAEREAERHVRRFLEGNASPLLAGEIPDKDVLEASGYQFYGSGIMEQLAQTPYRELIDSDVVWVGTPADVLERIEAVRELCEGLTEISITVNPGGAEHWKALKAQELFAAEIMPRLQDGAAEAEPVPLAAGAFS